MERRRLGDTDLAITPLGLGSWAIGGGDWCLGWGPQRDDHSIATVRQAIEEGFNWIDTASAYGLGRSETLIARALRPIPPRDRPYVFTKGGVVWDELGNVSRDLTAASIRRQVDDSLRRLRVDTIDLYQIDIPSRRCPLPSIGSLEEGWEALARLQEVGRIRWIGLVHADRRHLALARIAPVSSLQTPYSLLQPEAERDLLPDATSRRIGVLASSTMASGLLTGAMTSERLQRLPHNDWRRCSPFFQPDEVARAQPFVDRLRAVGDEHGVTPGAMAVAWVLQHPSVTAVVVGARRPEQVKEIASAAYVRGPTRRSMPSLTMRD